jgi:hypothetical protein
MKTITDICREIVKRKGSSTIKAERETVGHVSDLLYAATEGDVVERVLKAHGKRRFIKGLKR